MYIQKWVYTFIVSAQLLRYIPKNDEVHFIVEDNFGNLSTFRTDDPPVGFVSSNIVEFVAAWYNGVDPNNTEAS